MPFPARYSTTCPDCGEKIEPGDEIRWRDPHSGVTSTNGNAVVHADCERTPPPQPTLGAPCPECWLIHPADRECDA